MSSKYNLPMAAWHKAPAPGGYTGNHDRRYVWEGVHIVHWCNDADNEPAAIYINDKTGEVASDCAYLFTTAACPPDPNVRKTTPAPTEG